MTHDADAILVKARDLSFCGIATHLGSKEWFNEWMHLKQKMAEETKKRSSDFVKNWNLFSPAQEKNPSCPTVGVFFRQLATHLPGGSSSTLPQKLSEIVAILGSTVENQPEKKDKKAMKSATLRQIL